MFYFEIFLELPDTSILDTTSSDLEDETPQKEAKPPEKVCKPTCFYV